MRKVENHPNKTSLPAGFDDGELSVLPSQLNWLNKLRGSGEDPRIVVHEYLLYSDAHIIGEFRSSTGPYSFLNTVPLPSTVGTINAPIVLRAEMPGTMSIPDMSQTNESLYHGGELVDEIVALASLALGIRLSCGGLSRQFTMDGDPYGSPCDWARESRPTLRFRENAPLIPSVVGSHSLDKLDQLETIPSIEPARFVSLVRACKSYQEALWVSESEPNLAWLLLVSALETAANDTSCADVSPSELLKTAKPDLAQYLVEAGGPEHLEVVGNSIAHTLRATKKFIDFVVQFAPSAPAIRPVGRSLRLKWTRSNLKNVLGKVYEYRSRALHAGVPFPEPMFRPPFQARSDQPGSEVPFVGLGSYSSGGTWIPKDVPINLHSFHYITRRVLLKWWENELVQSRRSGNSGCQ